MFLDQNRAPLLDALIAHHAEGVHPFHVPGHKHGVGARDLLSLFGQTTLSFDLNAMHDLDDACNPVGVIDEAQRLAAHLFGADHAHFLVNGNTQGIHSMMLSAVGPGEQIVLPRNCHRSAITGLILSGGLPIYVPVEIDAHLGVATGPTVQSVRATLEKNPFVCALFVVNPSYYGFATDIEGMVRAAHDHRAAALVDEAHGTHLSFHPDFPANAMSVGADMSAVSMHKTGGSLTQSAILLSKGERVPHDILKESIDLIRSTSASYLLMVSLDTARRSLAQDAPGQFERVLQLARFARTEINLIEGLYSPGKEICRPDSSVFNYDESKLLIHCASAGFTGFEMERLLRDRFSIQVELADMNNVLALITIGTREEDILHLVGSLKTIVLGNNRKHSRPTVPPPLMPDVISSPRQAFYSPKKFMPLSGSAGQISGEMLMSYPPGIPIICPGERMTQDIIDYVRVLKEQGSLLQGTADPLAENIRVLGA